MNPVEIQDFKKIAHRFRRIYEIYLTLMKENQSITTWNRLDLGTLRKILTNVA